MGAPKPRPGRHRKDEEPVSTFESKLMTAFAFKDFDAIRSMLAGPDGPSWTDSRGTSALLWAARFGYEEIVDWMLARGADVGLQDFSGQTPLIAALEQRHPSIALRLIEHGSPIEAQDNRGNTALGRAVHWHETPGMDAVITLLLERGADIHRTNVAGISPLALASSTSADLARRLLGGR